jgi:quercetin dioxygenase-like cupin family protein
LRVKLEEGEFAHFDAGQTHSAHNVSDGQATVFLIRFLQHKMGSRTHLLSQLLVSRPSPRIVNRLVREMKVSAWTEKTRQEKGPPEKVLDTYGLAHFLQLLCSDSFALEGRGPTLDDVVNRCEAKQRKFTYSRAKFARLHAGEAQVKRDQLPELADIYGVSPVLFYDFLFPAFRYAVVVGEDNMKEIGPAFGMLEDGVTYRVPCRHLAYSDMTIALVELASESRPPENRHPGHELLKVLEGEVTVAFQGAAKGIVKQGEYAVFKSHIKHQVYNHTGKPARMLSFRFLE